MEEIKIGFLRGIGFFLSSLFITLIVYKTFSYIKCSKYVKDN